MSTIDNWLDEILKVPGTDGVFVATGRGKVAIKKAVPYKEKELEELSMRVLRMIAVFGDQDDKINEVEIAWKNHVVICKVSNNILLITFCKSPQVLSLLRITLNVSLSHLLQEKKIIKMARSHVTDRNIVLRRGNFDEQEMSLLTNL